MGLLFRHLLLIVALVIIPTARVNAGGLEEYTEELANALLTDTIRQDPAKLATALETLAPSMAGTPLYAERAEATITRWISQAKAGTLTDPQGLQALYTHVESLISTRPDVGATLRAKLAIPTDVAGIEKALGVPPALSQAIRDLTADNKAFDPYKLLATAMPETKTYTTALQTALAGPDRKPDAKDVQTTAQPAAVKDLEKLERTTNAGFAAAELFASKVLKDPKLATTINRVGKAVGTIVGLAKVFATGGIGALLSGDLLGGITSIFGGGGPSLADIQEEMRKNHQEVMEALNNLTQLVEQTRKEMHERFNRIEHALWWISESVQVMQQKLDRILFAVEQGFRDVAKDLNDIKHVLARLEVAVQANSDMVGLLYDGMVSDRLWLLEQNCYAAMRSAEHTISSAALSGNEDHLLLALGDVRQVLRSPGVMYRPQLDHLKVGADLPRRTLLPSIRYGRGYGKSPYVQAAVLESLPALAFAFRVQSPLRLANVALMDDSYATMAATRFPNEDLRKVACATAAHDVAVCRREYAQILVQLSGAIAAGIPVDSASLRSELDATFARAARRYFQTKFQNHELRETWIGNLSQYHDPRVAWPLMLGNLAAESKQKWEDAHDRADGYRYQVRGPGGDDLYTYEGNEGANILEWDLLRRALGVGVLEISFDGPFPHTEEETKFNMSLRWQLPPEYVTYRRSMGVTDLSPGEERFHLAFHTPSANSDGKAARILFVGWNFADVNIPLNTMREPLRKFSDWVTRELVEKELPLDSETSAYLDRCLGDAFSAVMIADAAEYLFARSQQIGAAAQRVRHDAALAINAMGCAGSGGNKLPPSAEFAKTLLAKHEEYMSTGVGVPAAKYSEAIDANLGFLATSMTQLGKAITEADASTFILADLDAVLAAGQ